MYIDIDNAFEDVQCTMCMYMYNILLHVHDKSNFKQTQYNSSSDFPQVNSNPPHPAFSMSALPLN